MLCKSLKIAYTPVDKYVVTLFMEVYAGCFVLRLFGLLYVKEGVDYIVIPPSCRASSVSSLSVFS
jgi:hypothetical protein